MAVFTAQTKSSSSWNAPNKHTASWAGQSHPTTTAKSGQYYGFGAFTYSGGQSLVGGTSWSTQTKS